MRARLDPSMAARYSSGFQPPQHEASFTVDAPSQTDGRRLAPWDFPPGSPGSRHTGARGGSEAPKEWLDRLELVWDDYELAWQPTTRKWVVWRYIAKDSSWSCVCELANPNNGVPFLDSLPELFLTYLRVADPRHYGSSKEAIRKAKEYQELQQADRERIDNDRYAEIEYTAKLHNKIGTHGKSKNHKIGSGIADGDRNGNYGF